MNKIYRSICLVALIMISFSAGAAKLVVSQGTEHCEFELASGDAVSINPATGDVSAIVTNLEDCMGPPEPPTITGFTAPSSVSPGGTIQLSWSTQGADSCQAVTTGVSNPLPGWSGSKVVPSGSQSITAPSPSSSTTYNARLQCSNNGGTVQQTRSITVNVGTPDECHNRPPPQGLDRATHAIWGDSSVDGRLFSQVFGAPFPGVPVTRQYYQQPGYYHAIKFNTGAMPSTASGTIVMAEPQAGGHVSNVMLGKYMVSFSECPGDFHQNLLPQGCYKVQDGDDPILWSGLSHHEVGHRCGLKPNTDYYLNIVYTGSPAGEPNPTWACIGSGSKPNCGAQAYATSTPSSW